MSSLRKQLLKCISTVRVVTKSACATSRLLIPSATIAATRRSLGVSASTPVSAVERGLAPAASSSSCARLVSMIAPHRPASSNPARNDSRASTRRPVRRRADRGGVRPVEVVDAHQERDALGQVRGHPVEAVQYGEGGVFARGCRCDGTVGGQEPRGKARRSRQRVRALFGRRPSEHAFEQLADDTVWQGLLELASPGMQHPKPRRGRATAGGA
jgi:hypothetical protein